MEKRGARINAGAEPESQQIALDSAVSGGSYMLPKDFRGAGFFLFFSMETTGEGTFLELID